MCCSGAHKSPLASSVSARRSSLKQNKGREGQTLRTLLARDRHPFVAMIGGSQADTFVSMKEPRGGKPVLGAEEEARKRQAWRQRYRRRAAKRDGHPKLRSSDQGTDMAQKVDRIALAPTDPSALETCRSGSAGGGDQGGGLRRRRQARTRMCRSSEPTISRAANSAATSCASNYLTGLSRNSAGVMTTTNGSRPLQQVEGDAGACATSRWWRRNLPTGRAKVNPVEPFSVLTSGMWSNNGARREALKAAAKAGGDGCRL